MKVTVCFGNIKVIVPCGSGDLTVCELQERACERYRKILGKSPNYRVQILQLESAIDRGIFDADDLISDVAEDREKLIAIFEEENYDSNEWHVSKDEEIEQRHLSSKKREPSFPDHRKYNSLEIDVGDEALRSNTRVMVRKDGQDFVDSSSSNYHQFQNERANGNIYDPRTDSSKSVTSVPLKPPNGYSPNAKTPIERRMNSKEQDYFRRGAVARQSKGSGLSETVDDYSVMYDHVASQVRDYPQHSGPLFTNDVRSSHLPWFVRDSQEFNLVNDGNVDALKVGSFIDRKSSKFAGLLIQSINQNSLIASEGHLMNGDVIVGINEHLLMDFVFEDAEAMLLESLTHSRVQLRILPVEDKERRAHDKSSLSNSSSSSRLISSSLNPGVSDSRSSRINSSSSSVSTHSSQSPKIKPVLNQLTADTVSRYTKKIGSRLSVQLKKGDQGLGFTLTSRDTMIGGPGPIYIKQILPMGAAVKNGRLLPGDRLLDIDGNSVLGKTQAEVVSMLRAVSIGSTVNITVSRQSENLPRKMDDASVDEVENLETDKEYFVFEIPLNDTGSAGLGIGLKGKHSSKSGEPSGVFVKNVICGGAASQDGRLLPNDQLIEVNGHSLRGLTNEDAIHILKTSMSTEANVCGYIKMVIARRRRTMDTSASQISSEASSDLYDLTFEQVRPELDSIATSDSHKQVDSSTSASYHSTRSISQSTDRSKTDSNENPDVIICDEEDLQWPDDEPFSRESTTRQSISEKRRNVIARPQILDSPKIERSGHKTDHHKPHSKQANKKEPRSNGKVLSPMRHSRTAPNLKAHINNNNNSTYAWRVPERRKLKKSASTESLNAEIEITGSNRAGNNTKQINGPHLGPSLGIAKSSSLESLQTAMRSVKHNNEPVFPNPRPFTKVVRGRVLNDSFRAALDQTTDTPQFSTLETRWHNGVKEFGYQQHSAPSSDDGSKNLKKKTKLFGFLKSNKTKKDESKEVTEGEYYRRQVEARKEKDAEKSKEESEKIEIYRQKLAQSRIADKTNSRHRDHVTGAPISAEPRIGTLHSKSNSTDASQHLSQPPPLPSSEHHTKRKADPASLRSRNRIKDRLNETPSYYSSLPRQTRRESGEIPPATTVPITSNSKNSERDSFHKKENLDFYHRQKPSSVKKTAKSSPGQHSQNSFHLSPEKLNDSSTKTDISNRGRRRKSENLSQNSSTVSFYHRELSPEVPQQSYYVVQNKNGSPSAVVLRRTPASKNAMHGDRHSVFTEQPSRLTTQISSTTPDRSWLRVTPKSSANNHGGSGRRTSVTPDSEVAERNRRAYHKLMHGPNIQRSLGKIEVSSPYDL